MNFGIRLQTIKENVVLSFNHRDGLQKYNISKGIGSCHRLCRNTWHLFKKKANINKDFSIQQGKFGKEEGKQTDCLVMYLLKFFDKVIHYLQTHKLMQYSMLRTYIVMHHQLTP